MYRIEHSGPSLYPIFGPASLAPVALCPRAAVWKTGYANCAPGLPLPQTATFRVCSRNYTPPRLNTRSESTTRPLQPSSRGLSTPAKDAAPNFRALQMPFFCACCVLSASRVGRGLPDVVTLKAIKAHANISQNEKLLCACNFQTAGLVSH